MVYRSIKHLKDKGMIEDGEKGLRLTDAGILRRCNRFKCMPKIHSIMSFIHSLETKEKIALMLLESGKDHSIRSVAKAVGIDYRTVYQNIERLASEGIVAIRRAGNTRLCSFARTLNKTVFSVETYRKEKLLKNSNLLQLHKRILKMKSPFYTCLIFGSYATGKQAKHSDIDIMFVCENAETFEKAVKDAMMHIPLDLHYLVFSYTDFRKMAKDENTVVGQALKACIILHGIEAFYEMME